MIKVPKKYWERVMHVGKFSMYETYEPSICYSATKLALPMKNLSAYNDEYMSKIDSLLLLCLDDCQRLKAVYLTGIKAMRSDNNRLAVAVLPDISEEDGAGGNCYIIYSGSTVKVLSYYITTDTGERQEQIMKVIGLREIASSIYKMGDESKFIDKLFSDDPKEALKKNDFMESYEFGGSITKDMIRLADEKEKEHEALEREHNWSDWSFPEGYGNSEESNDSDTTLTNLLSHVLGFDDEESEDSELTEIERIKKTVGIMIDNDERLITMATENIYDIAKLQKDNKKLKKKVKLLTKELEAVCEIHMTVFENRLKRLEDLLIDGIPINSLDNPVSETDKSETSINLEELVQKPVFANFISGDDEIFSTSLYASPSSSLNNIKAHVKNKLKCKSLVDTIAPVIKDEISYIDGRPEKVLFFPVSVPKSECLMGVKCDSNEDPIKGYLQTYWASEDPEKIYFGLTTKEIESLVKYYEDKKVPEKPKDFNWGDVCYRPVFSDEDIIRHLDRSESLFAKPSNSLDGIKGLISDLTTITSLVKKYTPVIVQENSHIDGETEWNLYFPVKARAMVKGSWVDTEGYLKKLWKPDKTYRTYFGLKGDEIIDIINWYKKAREDCGIDPYIHEYNLTADS